MTKTQLYVRALAISAVALAAIAYTGKVLQFPLQPELVGEMMGFVRENTVVDVTFHDALAIGVELPSTVVLKVVEAEAATRGDTATNVKKDAVLETGLKIRVPAHIKVGEDVKISTADGEFQGRA